MPIAALRPGATTPDIYYLHADHLGTPRKITRPSDNRVVWTWESEAFGNSLPDQNPSGLGSFVFNLRFPGQYYDQETGLFYNYFRDYDPATGRYVESDPIGLRGGINTYSYVGNNPVNYTDPKGLFALPLAIPIGQALVDAATVVLSGAMIADSINPSNQTWVDDPNAAMEHDEYKTRAAQTPPPDLDECERLQWLLQREQDVVNSMEQWDSKWLPGRHSAAIQQRKNAVNKLQQKIKEKCGKCEK